MMKKFIIVSLIILPTVAAAGFPEFGFCPLGGPPGWFNRLPGQYDRSYTYPPPLYPRLVPDSRQAPALIYPSFSRPVRPEK